MAKPWTTRELEILINNGPALSWEELSKLLPNRSYRACQTRLSKLRGKLGEDKVKKKASQFTESEDRILLRIWQTEPLEDFPKHLPGKSITACRMRIAYLRKTRGLEIPKRSESPYLRSDMSGKMQPNNTTGVPNVFYNKARDSYGVSISIKKHVIYLSSYKTIEEAIAARDATNKLIDQWQSEGKLTHEFLSNLTSESFGKHLSRANSTGYTGVFWNKHRGNYIATVSVRGADLRRSIYLGSYKDPKEAAEIATAARNAYRNLPNRNALTFEEIRTAIRSAVKPNKQQNFA